MTSLRYWYGVGLATGSGFESWLGTVASYLNQAV